MRVTRRKFLLLGAGALAIGAIKGCKRGSAPGTVRIPRGAGGVGFLPLLVMEKERLIQRPRRNLAFPALNRSGSMSAGLPP